MSTIGNILWFLFGGLIGGLAWVLAGCLWCITIIGIPVGLQCFKFASLAFFPFGKEVMYGGGGFSFLVNLIWIIFFGLEMAIGYCIQMCIRDSQIQMFHYKLILIISHVRHLLYATRWFLASTSSQSRMSSLHRYSLHIPMWASFRLNPKESANQR